MITILGFLTALLPEVMKYFQDKQDKAHEAVLYKLELEKAKIELERAKLGIVSNERIQEMQVDLESLKASLGFQSTSSKWVRNIISLMPIVITFFFMADYVWVTYLEYDTLKNSGIPFTASVIGDLFWPKTDSDNFAGIISYWIARRTISKL